MKMVKVNGKMVPFFAADGKGSGDLKKAMYGMKMKSMGEGGKMYKYMEGGEIYQIMEEGGEVEKNQGPIKGMDNLQGRFRVIPEPKNPTQKDSPIEYKFYVDGEEMSSVDFTSALREADPNVDVNEVVMKSAQDAGLRWDNADGRWSYTGSSKQSKMNIGRGMEERKAFEEGGSDAVRDIYRDREESLRRREMAGRLNYMRTQ